ncbi:hypothetical protein HMPREF9554_02906 [Treponema phagedenis F0421]|nr:hypothetical protein HMPREF9554_02906 [Treponema phagedenis F0421]
MTSISKTKPFCRLCQKLNLRVLKLYEPNPRVLKLCKQSCFKTSFLFGTIATHLFLVFLIKSVLRV